MYPFEIKFTRIIDKLYEQNKVKYLLETARELIAMYRIDNFSNKKNKLSFKNCFFRFRVIFGLMDSINYGSVEVFETEKHTIGVTYTVSLMRFWFQIILITLVLLVTTQQRTTTMAVCILIGAAGWIYNVLRHRWFLKVIVSWMEKSGKKEFQHY